MISKSFFLWIQLNTLQKYSLSFAWTLRRLQSAKLGRMNFLWRLEPLKIPDNNSRVWEAQGEVIGMARVIRGISLEDWEEKTQLTDHELQGVYELQEACSELPLPSNWVCCRRLWLTVKCHALICLVADERQIHHLSCFWTRIFFRNPYTRVVVS